MMIGKVMGKMKDRTAGKMNGGTIGRLTACLLILALAGMVVAGCSGAQGATTTTAAAGAATTAGSAETTAAAAETTAAAATTTTKAATSGGDGYTLNTLGEYPLVTEGSPSISSLVPWSDADHAPEDNTGFHWLEEKTGVHINWQAVPPDGWTEKRNITIASGNLPDYIAATANFGNAAFTSTEILQYGSQGIFVDLKPLLAENSIHLKQILADHPEWDMLITTKDGKLYATPDFNVCYHCKFSLRAWINTDWLTRLNLEMPSTTEEFKQTLIAFKEQDANGNGDPNDEIPFSTSIDGWNTMINGFLMNPFVLTNGVDAVMVDTDKKQVYFSPVQDGYREGLRYLNDLYTNGLIAPESFTQNGDTLKQTNEAGDASKVGSTVGGTEASTLGFAVSQRFKEYSVLPPLEGPTGIRQSPEFLSGAGIGLGAITSAAKDPALIMRWLDFFYSEEGTIMGDLGEEGVYWRPCIPENGEIDFRGNPAKFFRIPQPPEITSYMYKWGQTLPSNRSKEYRESMSVSGNSLDWRAAPEGDLELNLFQAAEVYETYSAGEDKTLPSIAIDPEKISDYTLVKTSINDYVKESTARFVVGELSVDKDWESYVQMMDQLGLADYLAITQTAYDEFISR
ncbi:MAG: extracellular solute-binding protein [Clostridiales bacterium]|jgi:putative aldouronate transport system substrate-binding protein|nr:extracellular solute-binding protein [Clostridiales bacterium]